MDAGAPRRHAAILMGASQIASRERLFLATADLLADRGWRVTLMAPRPIPELRAAAVPPLKLVDIAEVGGVHLPKLTPHLLCIYGGLGRVTRFLKAERPDVLMGTSIPPNIVALLAARRAGTGTPVVIRQSNPVPLKADPGSRHVHKRPRDWLMPWLYPKAAAAIAVSSGVAQNLEASGWFEDGRIHWIPNGVDLEAVGRQAAEPSGHPWLDAPDGPPVVVAVGRLIRKKDYPALLRAFARIAADRPVRLVVLGEGPERGRIEALARELGLAERIDFVGHVANPFAFMARAALFVLASRFEGMPSVVIEALACGCPVVSTDCPSGPAEILGDGAYGGLVPMADPAALAAAMATALDAPRDPARLQARAGEFALKRTVARYADVLTRAAAGPAAPDSGSSPARP